MLKWKWKTLGEYIHVTVFYDSNNCGRLCFSEKEFKKIMKKHKTVTFVEEV